MARYRRVTADGCWEWTGTVLKNGYGKVTVNYETRLVHRYAYEELTGPIPKGHQIDHICRNRICFNPAHLEAVLPKENNRRSGSPSAKNAVKTHCDHGHELTPENVYIWAKRPNSRLCRACMVRRSKTYYGRRP